MSPDDLGVVIEETQIDLQDAKPGLSPWAVFAVIAALLGLIAFFVLRSSGGDESAESAPPENS
jgi:hypothetical protein